MPQRVYREATPEVRKKVSDAMKEYHANKSWDAKMKTAEKQSASMKRYWSSIPSKQDKEGTSKM